MNCRKIIILGTGPAGLTAAIYTARAELDPLVITGSIKGGQLTTTTEVENFPGFPNGIFGAELMLNMEEQAKKFGASLVEDAITSVDLSNRPFTLKGRNKSYLCDNLIIATGAKPKMLGAKGEAELLGYGLSTCATCDGAFYRNSTVTVIGGGDSACEDALFLSRIASKVYLVHRRDELRATPILRDRVFADPKIEMVWSRELKEVHGTKEGGVTHITLINKKTNADETLNCEGVFIAVGHIPTTSLFQGQLELDDLGYIKTKPDSTLTNVEGVFACGDVKDRHYRQAITAAGSGCMAALDLEKSLKMVIGDTGAVAQNS